MLFFVVTHDKFHHGLIAGTVTLKVENPEDNVLTWKVPSKIETCEHGDPPADIRLFCSAVGCFPKKPLICV